ncbi:DUF1707 domain-containing protein [Nonomuraea sp. NPDC049714]|uniref:DUF1707 domain-containing protein n=1 Tax=Nonomuraea sp. NPDC049714 TaxID=3364357 RepID=UPI0037AD6A11
MDEQPEVRASDGDRESAARRLRLAVEDGSLDFTEFDDRLGLAFQAVTRRELDHLTADLPPAAPAATGMVAPLPAAVPRWLRLGWAVWGAAAAIGVVSWVVASVQAACPLEFWPKDLLGPGLVLLIVTVVAARRREAPGR